MHIITLPPYALTASYLADILKRLYNVAMNSKYSPYLLRCEEEIHKALPQNPSKDWLEQSFGKLDSAVQVEHVQPLIEPTLSLVNLGGKRWRPLLLVLTAQAYLTKTGKFSQESMEDIYALVPLVEFIHTASLIHDDIEDRSDSRRGKPCAYITYGTDTAINAATWLYFEAASCIQRSHLDEETKMALYACYSQEVRRLHLGQAMDIAWHNSNEAEPSPQEYLAMVQNKTGTLASLAVRTGLLATHGEPKAIEKLTNSAKQIGAGFQVIDDVLNLTSGNAGKNRGDDIVEGKKSLPVMLFITSCRKENQDEKISELKNCFTQAKAEGIKSPAVERAIELLSKNGAIEKARQQGISFIENACSTFENYFGKDNEASCLITALFREMANG